MAVETQKSLEEQNAELREEVERLRKERDEALSRLQAVLQQRYGRHSERFVDHPTLPFDEPEPVPPPHVDEAPDDECDESASPQRKRRRGAPRLPKDIERVEETIEPTDEERRCTCCGEQRETIGFEITEKLEYSPASCYLRVIKRPKLVCKAHEEAGVTTPDLPPQAIHKGLAGETMLAQVITAKYCDHLPLHRQAGIYRRQDIDIPESTLCDWIRQSSELLRPIVDAIHARCLSSGYVATDDTTITLLTDASPKNSKRAFLWVYLGEQPGDVVFDFTEGRSRDGPARMLKSFQGFLQADAYGGYDALYVDGTIQEVGCMAHARRRFFDAQGTDRDNAEIALRSIGALYHVERECKERALTHDERLVARQQDSAEVFITLLEWLTDLQHRVLPRSPIGKAVSYFVANAEALRRFLTNGRLEIDNNRAERAMRKVAVGRKNWLFAGSEAGGHRAAVLYSLTVGCWELSVDPFEYFVDVLRRLPSTPSSEILRLSPRGWAAERRH